MVVRQSERQTDKTKEERNHYEDNNAMGHLLTNRLMLAIAAYGCCPEMTEAGDTEIGNNCQLIALSRLPAFDLLSSSSSITGPRRSIRCLVTGIRINTLPCDVRTTNDDDDYVGQLDLYQGRTVGSGLCVSHAIKSNLMNSAVK